MQKGLLSLLREELTDKAQKFAVRYVKYKHGNRAEVCTVTADDGYIYFKTSKTEGSIGIKFDAGDICVAIRKQCGDNALMIHGLPKPNQSPHIVVLLPTPSLFAKLGVSDFFAFIKEWKGNSVVGDLEVVRYINIKDI